MIERLPTPWGLVRLGVAPDHPNLKTVSRAFERIAQRPGFRFFGNVEFGRDVGQADLEMLYDAVVLAVGAQTDRRLGIPGEDLPGSWAATELVAWYNGHPDFQELSFDLSGERAVVVGNGNVALDVARMLALTREELAPTDTTDPAIEAIAESRLREIVVLGRRGPVQAAWTSTELQEMGELAGADIVVDPGELELDAASAAELEAGSNIVQRNFEILRGFAAREPAGRPRTVRLRFRVSPVAILGDVKVEAIELARNTLEPDGKGSVRAVATEERETIPADIVFRASAITACRSTACPSTRRPGRSRTRAVASSTPRAGDSGPLRGGLDQARPDRRHRDEQERRHGDGRAPARGRAGRPSSRAGRRRHAGVAARGARRRGGRVRGLGGDRHARAEPRRAPRPPSDQAVQLGRAPRGRAELTCLWINRHDLGTRSVPGTVRTVVTELAHMGQSQAAARLAA